MERSKRSRLPRASSAERIYQSSSKASKVGKWWYGWPNGTLENLHRWRKARSIL